MNTPLQQLVPVLDMTKDIDMDLQPGTPMMPNKPAILIWYRNHSLQNSGVFATLNVNSGTYLLYNARQDDFNGVALIVRKTAITTFSKQLIPVSELLLSHHIMQPCLHSRWRCVLRGSVDV